MVNIGLSKVILKKKRNLDEIKKFLNKYDFVPEYFPDVKKLFSQDNSIHKLKVLRNKNKKENLNII